MSSDRGAADVLTNVAGDADLPGACDSERMPQIIGELQGLGLAIRYTLPEDRMLPGET